MPARTTPQERARPGRRRRTVKEHGPDPADVHVGSRLRLARGLLGLSQVQVAQSLGVSFQAVQKYERGEIRVSASRLLQASRLLGQPLEFFFEGLDSPSSSDGDKGEFVRAELELLRAFRALRWPERASCRAANSKSPVFRRAYITFSAASIPGCA